MGKILYLECNSGISGDMTVGALLDLGADRNVLEEKLKSLGVEGYHLHFGRTSQYGLDAYDFDVHLEENEDEAGHGHGHGHSHEGMTGAEHCHEGTVGAEHSHEGMAGAEHSHEGIAGAEHSHEEMAGAEHSHGEMAGTEHSHEGMAGAEHSHGEMTGTVLSHEEMADAEHSHEGMAGVEHSHEEIAGTEHSHGEVAGAEHSHAHAASAGSEHTHTHTEPAEHQHSHGDPDEHSHLHDGHHHDGHHHSHPHTHRNLTDIYEIIDRLDSTDQVKNLAKKMFLIVAEAEAKAHGLPMNEVHFHEVGAIDSIVDILSVSICLDNLGIEEVVVSPLTEGHGYVRCQHGLIPVPVPATANIAAAHGLVLRLTDQEGEMVTPTGAAIAAALKTMDKLPESCRIVKTGMGAGKRDFGRPNVLRAMILETVEKENVKENKVGVSPSAAAKTVEAQDAEMWVLETNIDDCSGEMLGFVMESLPRTCFLSCAENQRRRSWKP